MLRIDESSNTLVAPQQGGFVPEAPLERSQLLALLASGWQAFAHEMGEPSVQFCAAEPVAGLDLLAFDAASGRAVVAAGEVAGWDAERLGEVHAALEAAVPGETPRVLLVGAEFDERLLACVDWLVRRHGFEVTARAVTMLRFGAERLMQVQRAYPPAPIEPPATGQGFFADVVGPPPSGGAHSAPPPGVPAS